MRGSSRPSLERRSVASHPRFSACGCFALLFLLVGFFHAELLLAAAPQSVHKKQSRPRELDRGIVWERNQETGELRAISRSAGKTTTGLEQPSATAIQVVAQMVAITCSVATSDGQSVPGLTRADFRVFDNGVLQKISYFDASTQPASVAIVIDAS